MKTYSPRLTLPLASWRDPDGVKLYTISASSCPVDHRAFIERFAAVKKERTVDWPATPAFAIFHSGATMLYLVLAWWEGNELFASVSVREGDSWIEDPHRFSFCVWDLEVFWFERNSFVRHLYSGTTDLAAYRKDLKEPQS
jgi:hypothetical protein